MKKWLLLLLLLFTVGVFAQDAGGDAGTSAGVNTTGTTGTTGTAGGTGGTTTGNMDLTATLKEVENLKVALASQKKELDEQKTAAELAKLNEADRAKALLDNERKALESERQALTLDRNTVFGKSILLSEKVNVGSEFLPYLNITATDTEANITNRATNLKSALDAYVKRFIDDKTAGFDPDTKKGEAGSKDNIAAYAAKLAGNSGMVKDNPYFKL